MIYVRYRVVPTGVNPLTGTTGTCAACVIVRTADPDEAVSVAQGYLTRQQWLILGEEVQIVRLKKRQDIPPQTKALAEYDRAARDGLSCDIIVTPPEHSAN